jgi:hypothetical protein
MSSVTHSHRLGRIQILAAALMCGGICAVSLPWLLTAFAEFPQPAAGPSSNITPTRFEAAVPLPTRNLQGKEALLCDFELLREGLRLLEQTADYTGTFRKQERIDGVLDKGSLIQVKSRHEPLSLYLKWLKGDTGRELLFVKNERDGEMLVRLGGIRGRLLPALKIDPDGDLARQKVRHHISRVSILNLTRQVVEHSERDLHQSAGVRCELLAEDSEKPIRVIREYESPKVGGDYRKAMHFIDRGTLLPVKILTYGWPEEGETIPQEELDAETLLEDYEYSDLQFDLPLSDEDFSEHNPGYSFHRGR